MPAHSKKTPQRMTQLRELHAKGCSDREIGEAVGVSHATVADWRVAIGLVANANPAGPRSRRRPPAPPTAVRVDAAQAAEVLSEDLSALAPAEQVSRRLATVRALVTRLEKPVERDEYPATSYAQLVALETRLTSSLAELTPAAPVDPETDPANEEMADGVRAKLARLVSVAESSFRCHRCGESPYPPEHRGGA